MKKIGLMIGMVLMTVMTFAQAKQISETKVESPKFVGLENNYSEASINDYLKSSLESNENYEAGVVEVLFIINENGSVSNINIENSVSAINDNSVIASIRNSSGYWKAGMVNGKPVAMERRLFINFVDPKQSSLEELAQEHLEVAIKKYNKGLKASDNPKYSVTKANKKSQRKFRTAINFLDEAHKYQPGEPSIIFWQACAYQKSGNEVKYTEKFNEFMEAVELNYQANNNVINIQLN